MDSDSLDVDPALIDAIVAWAEAHDLPPDLLLALAYGESGLDAGRSGDAGQSWGAFMAHIPAHGHDPAYWTGVEGARRTMDVMAQRWTEAFVRLRGRERWSAGDGAARVAFFCEYWPAAQGCRPPDVEQCRRAVTVATDLSARRRHKGERTMGEDAGLFRDPATGWLLPAAGPVTQGFGLTPFAHAHPDLYGPQGHPGIDIGAAAGSAVRCVRAGSVVYASWRNRAGAPVDDGTGYGITVWVREPDGTLHIYAHLAQALVTVGDAVERGAPLGTVGDTGRAAGAHLHYEVRRGDTPVDPSPYLRPGGSSGGIPVVVRSPEGLNLRAAPSAEAPVLATMVDGSGATLRRGAWWPVQAGGVSGFAWGEFLDVDSAIDRLVAELRSVRDAATEDLIRAELRRARAVAELEKLGFGQDKPDGG